MPRLQITLRQPIFERVEAEKVKEDRSFSSEMVSVLVEEALDARDKKAGRK